ncbi:Low-affinity iron/zinc ion transport protein fet4 [Helicostylum pulchrum]|uniref:Uncharacterized protein n=1 Tax=Helicostylum pulchrum TaxID=562976 RepID=A0ABP9XWW0_9FUNG|nr:Low-affinity iron/zinc ion transport protein fet4 [Helicostylum pulchrum]
MSLLYRTKEAFCAPGRQRIIEFSAPTQTVTKSSSYSDISERIAQDSNLFNPEKPKSKGGRIFDNVTQRAGSLITFMVTLLILAVWAVVGIILGAPEIWQIIMQNGGSIQCYISDTLLMRQQQNHCYKLLTIISQLRSRNATVARLVHDPELHNNAPMVDKESIDQCSIEEAKLENAINLPNEFWFDKCCNWVSMAVGSIYALIFYWAGILVWVGLGPMMEFSDLWQLYINTAVAVELTFTSMFLQNIRRRHMEYLEKCLRSIMRTDCELEIILRRHSNDNKLNPVITILPHPVTRSIRAIDYYGDIIGSGIGVTVSTCVFAVWLSIGDVMAWSDDWWLIIGTYTGLVGFIDGFVLRNVYFREDVILDEQFDVLSEADDVLFQYLNVPLPTKPVEQRSSLITRISNYMGVLCAKSFAVLVSILIVLALMGVASSMGWNQTGQLLCNTPTMIIEGFLLIVLIQAHNLSNMKRRIQLRDILVRRIALLQYAKNVTGMTLNENDTVKFAINLKKADTEN